MVENSIFGGGFRAGDSSIRPVRGLFDLGDLVEDLVLSPQRRFPSFRVLFLKLLDGSQELNDLLHEGGDVFGLFGDLF